MRRGFLAIVLLVIVCGVGSAQTGLDTWANLLQLKPGQTVTVMDATYKKVKGRLVKVSEDAVSLRLTKNKEVVVPRSDVVLVSQPPARAKHILLAVLFGALYGAEALARPQRDNDDCDCSDDERGPTGRLLAISAAAGAAAFGLAQAFTAEGDRIIFASFPRPPSYEAPMEMNLVPETAGLPEGGNTFAPVSPQNEKSPQDILTPP